MKYLYSYLLIVLCLLLKVLSVREKSMNWVIILNFKKDIF